MLIDGPSLAAIQLFSSRNFPVAVGTAFPGGVYLVMGKRDGYLQAAMQLLFAACLI